jgi:hypothetical protein
LRTGKGEKLRKKPFFKLISDYTLFDDLGIDPAACVNYCPDHNLDEDSWFKVEEFSAQTFCVEMLKGDFDAKVYDDLAKRQFNDISYLVASQGKIFIFRKSHLHFS